MTGMLRHLNCPRYFESELIQRPLRAQFQNWDFIANLDSRWVFEFRFGSDKAQVNAHLYTLQVLHCLHGAPGINPFLGLVLDDESKIVKEFLAEFSIGGNLLDLLARPVEWERREKWCRQIVQSVTEIHSKGFVVGCLAAQLTGGIQIDDEDNVVLGCFQTTFAFDNAPERTLPPEYRHLQLTEGSLRALPRTDIYQLGLLLWQIAANKHSLRSSDLWKNAGWLTNANTIGTEFHAHLVRVPMQGEIVPQYLKDMIAACRDEDPDLRPPARELLKRFPCPGKGNTVLTKLKDTFTKGAVIREAQ